MAWLAVLNVVLMEALFGVGGFFSCIENGYFFPLYILLIDIAAILPCEVGLLLLEGLFGEEVLL